MMSRYEWRDDQLWDNERECWVLWRGIGAIGMSDEVRAMIEQAHETREDAARARSLLAECARCLDDEVMGVGSLRDRIAEFLATRKEET